MFLPLQLRHPPVSCQSALPGSRSRVLALSAAATARLRAPPPPRAATAAARISPDEVTPAVPVAAAQDQQAQSRKRGVGRGLAWSNEELTSLVAQAYDIGGDLVVGSGQSADKYAERIRDAFAQKAPVDACQRNGTRCGRDSRRWQRLSPFSCLKKYKAVISVCTRLRDKIKQVDAVQLTGSPSSDDLDRVA
jgi:hypothetical protein